MLDWPWRRRKLSPGHVEQMLRRKGCTKLRELEPDIAVWAAPTGRRFTISTGEIHSEQLERIIAEIEGWVENSRVR